MSYPSDRIRPFSPASHVNPCESVITLCGEAFAADHIIAESRIRSAVGMNRDIDAIGFAG